MTIKNILRETAKVPTDRVVVLPVKEVPQVVVRTARKANLQMNQRAST